MTILPVITVQAVRGGFSARNAEIGLVGHGSDEERAISTLRSAVEIWARCLARDGILKASLQDRKVTYRETGERIAVEPRLVAVSD